MIRLRVEGLRLERLLERALEGGATFRSVERENPRAFVLDANARSAAVMEALCARWSIRCERLELRGVDAAKRVFARRWTLVPGLALCALLLFLYGSRIWQIDVAFVGERLPRIAEADVREMLKDLGAAPGARASDIDADALAQALSARSEAFSFVGARVVGVRLLVEIAPSLPEPDLYDPAAARDMVAAADGIIVSVTAEVGVAAVSPGDIVRKGDVLIRGEERLRKDVTYGVAARGEVVARTWASAEAVADTHAVERRFTGRESVGSSLVLLHWSLPLIEADTLFPSERDVEYLPVGGLFLPLMIERATEREYEEKSVPVDENALRETLARQALALAETEVEGYGAGVRQIVDKWIDYSMIEEGRLRARAVVEVQRDIATTREALLRGGS